MTGPTNQRLGFACNWDPVPERTWSGTAWWLYRALSAHADCVDVGVHVPAHARRGIQALSMRPRRGGWVPVWEHSRIWQAALEGRVRRNVRTSECEAVLEIQDIAVIPDTPFFVYQDLSYDLVQAHLADPGSGASRFFRTLDQRTLQRRRERQLSVYEKASGVIAMSQWLADSLIRDTGLPPHKVHVAHPGASACDPTQHLPLPRLRTAPRRRLLFLGTTFHVKGGDIAVEAFGLLRAIDP